jgi:hypothetical protein
MVGLRTLIEQRTLSLEEFHLQCCMVLFPDTKWIDPTDGDRLHISDWATNCMTQTLSGAITATIEVRASAVLRAFS